MPDAWPILPSLVSALRTGTSGAGIRRAPILEGRGGYRGVSDLENPGGGAR